MFVLTPRMRNSASARRARRTAVGKSAPAGDELDEHRVEVRADRGARVRGAAVEPDPGATGRAVGGDDAGVGAEAVGRVLGGDAALQGGAVQPDAVLGQAEVGEGLAGGDPDLGLHEVDVRHLLGDGVLDLDPRVHLDEHVPAGVRAGGVEQELDGAGVDVADLPSEGHRVSAERVADGRVERRGRRDLDDLLVPALHGAVPFEQVHGLAGGVREDLDLDVPGPQDRLLDEQGGVAERALGLTHGRAQRLTQLCRVVDAPHPPPAAARHGLREDREADLLGGRHELVDVRGRGGRPQHRHPGRAGGLDRTHLVARHREHPRRRPHEGDARRRARAGQARVLGQEAVPRVHRVGARLPRHPDDLVDVEVGPDRVTALADQVGLVGLRAVDGVAVLPREHGDRPDAQLVRGAEGPDGDLAAVGDEEGGEHGAPGAYGGRVRRKGHGGTRGSHGSERRGLSEHPSREAGAIARAPLPARRTVRLVGAGRSPNPTGEDA